MLNIRVAVHVRVQKARFELIKRSERAGVVVVPVCVCVDVVIIYTNYPHFCHSFWLGHTDALFKWHRFGCHSFFRCVRAGAGI